MRAPLPFTAFPAAALLFAATVAGLSPSIADEGDPDDVGWSRASTPAEDADATATGVAYRFRIEGVEDEDLADLLQRGSELASLVDKPPISRAALLNRIENDRQTFDTILRSEGWYAGTIESNFDNSTSPPTVVMRIDPGPRFKLKSFAVVPFGETEKTPVPLPGVNDLGLTMGEPARAADVVAAERRLLAWLGDRAHPLARLGDREVIVDHADRSMRVTVAVDPGPPLAFGPLSIEGLDKVEENYVRLLVPWTEGELFDRRKVEEFRRKLARTGLFSTVVVSPAAIADADGRLPITVETAEAKQRSIGGGFKYYTSEGPAGEAFWELRNVFGRDEDLRVTVELGRIAQQGTVDVLVPNWRRVDQTLVGQALVQRETTDAFDKKGIEVSGQIRRVFDEFWAAGVGPSVETAWITENNETDNSTLFGLPAFVLRDSTDTPLDPTEGSRLRFAPTPYVGWYQTSQLFMTNELSATGYYSLDNDRRYILAGRAKFGSLFGESRDSVPADKRFYAGGGNSIRGYPFQKVGPLNDDNDPIGGRSLVEFSAELRARVWGNFGVVPFIDGGTVFASVVPDFADPLRWGAGLGLRYYTAIGPVRVDLATPLNPRKDVDDPFQFYISLGQSF